MAHDHHQHGHSHAHGHSHDHAGHSHAPDNFGWAFAIGAALNTAFVTAELIFGYAANSLALISDALHNLSDVVALLLAWGAAWLSQKKPTQRHTYGYRRASILAALFNAGLLLVAVGGIVVEAVNRLAEPAPVANWTVIWVAALGILVNGGTALLFMRGRHSDLNIRGAYLHMAADAGVSAAVVFAGLVILWTGQRWVDPVMSLAVAVVILWSSVGLLKESVWMSLAGVPSGIDVDVVEAELALLDGVETVHDLHVWPLSTTETALTAHLVAPGVASTDDLLQAARRMLHDRFRIEHCTLQVERNHLEDTRCC